MIRQLVPGTGFNFRSPSSQVVTGSHWLGTWSALFPSSKYSENVYLELLDRGPELSDEGIEILGAWKDAALKSTSLQNPSGHLFGRVRVLFNGKWNPGTSCAYSSWQQIPSRLPTLKQQLDRQEYSRFLTDLAEMQYEKTARGGHLTEARFGLSRATYVLHVFSRGNYPIYDRWTHCAMYQLTDGEYRGQRIHKSKHSQPTWYLENFVPFVREVASVCNAANDQRGLRNVDKALFAYGKLFKQS
jgi:hypothetical protein